MIEPAKLTLTLRRNATFDPVFIWKDEDGDPIDMTGCTVEMTVKDSSNSRASKLHLHSNDGSLTLEGSSGRISANVPPAQLSRLKIGKMVFDLRVAFPSGYFAVIAEGDVDVLSGVTE